MDVKEVKESIQGGGRASIQGEGARATIDFVNVKHEAVPPGGRCEERVVDHKACPLSACEHAQLALKTRDASKPRRLEDLFLLGTGMPVSLSRRRTSFEMWMLEGEAELQALRELNAQF